MNFRDRRIYLCLILLICPVSLYFWKQTHCFTNSYFIYIDPLLHQNIHADLKNKLITDFKAHKNSSAYIQLIKEQFSFIDRVWMSRESLSKINIQVSAAVPLFRINENHILLRNGSIVSRSLFDEHVSENLNSIKLAVMNNKIEPAVFHWLNNQPNSLFSQFTVLVKSPTEILLTDPKANEIEIICSVEQNITSPLLKQVSNIIALLETSGNKKKNASSWKIDIRFAGRIVLNKGKGSA